MRDLLEYIILQKVEFCRIFYYQTSRHLKISFNGHYLFTRKYIWNLLCCFKTTIHGVLLHLMSPCMFYISKMRSSYTPTVTVRTYQNMRTKVYYSIIFLISIETFAEVRHYNWKRNISSLCMLLYKKHRNGK